MLKPLLLSLALAVSAHADMLVNLRITDHQDHSHAYIAALQLSSATGAIPSWARCSKMFRVAGTGSMMRLLPDANAYCVIEPIPFADVVKGDVVVFKPKQDAASIAKYGKRTGYIMHPVVSRTPDRITTCGMDSIRNVGPTSSFDGPVERDNYVGVIRQAFRWK